MESIVSIGHQRCFSVLVLSGSVLNVQKLVSLLNANARIPLVLQMQKKTGHHTLLTEFLLLAAQNVPFLHNYETLLCLNISKELYPFLTMSSRPIHSIDCFTALFFFSFFPFFFFHVFCLSATSVIHLFPQKFCLLQQESSPFLLQSPFTAALSSSKRKIKTEKKNKVLSLFSI